MAPVGTSRPAPVPAAADGRTDRRRAERHDPAATRWQRRATVRPGMEVVILNISADGALVESAGRPRPGRAAELYLSGALNARLIVRGRVDRSHVASLAPLRYRAVILFDEPLEIGAIHG